MDEFKKYLPKERPFVPKIRRLKKSHNGTRCPSLIATLRKVRGGFKLKSRVIKKTKTQSKRSAFNQRVNIKSRIVKFSQKSASKGLKAHLKYLKREGVGIDGSEATYFDSTLQKETNDVTHILKDWKNDRHYFRIIISPENGKDLDLNLYIKDLMKGIEGDLCTKLTWVSCAHYNTDKPHIHLLIRGVNDKGEDLVISKDYMSYGMRQKAEDLATKYLGQRTLEELKRALDGEIKKDRFTSLDRVLQAKFKADGVIDLRPKKELHDEKRLRLIGRLKYLRELNLSKEVVSGKWELALNFEQTLRSLSIQNDIVKRMNEALKSNYKEDFLVYNPEKSKSTFYGRVLKRGLEEELNEKPYLIVETVNKKHLYVSLSKSSELSSEIAKEGDYVLVKPYGVRLNISKADKNIYNEALKNKDLIYDINKHLTVVKETIKLPKNVTPEEYIEVHQKRLDTLQKRGKVLSLGNGQYKIDKDFLEKVTYATKDKSLSVPFVRRCSSTDLNTQKLELGVTWLDYLKQSSSINEHTSNEIRDALNERTLFHKSLKIDDKDLIDKLYNIELLNAEASLSKTYGRANRLSEHTDFEGVYRESVNLPSGKHLVIVGEGGYLLISNKRQLDYLNLRDRIRVTTKCSKHERDYSVPYLKDLEINYSKLKNSKKRKVMK